MQFWLVFGIGAATALLDDASWTPAIKDPITGEMQISLYERARPFSIIADSNGERLMNDAQSYVDCGRAQFARHNKSPAIPARLIMDSRHRSRYMFGSLLPRARSENIYVKRSADSQISTR